MILGKLQVKIQTGMAGAGDVFIDEVSDISRCIVLSDGGSVSYLKDTKTLNVTLNATPDFPATVSWTVIELGGAV